MNRHTLITFVEGNLNNLTAYMYIHTYIGNIILRSNILLVLSTTTHTNASTQGTRKIARYVPNHSSLRNIKRIMITYVQFQ